MKRCIKIMSKSRGCVLFWIVLAIILVGCASSEPTETERRIFRAMIQLADLPSGWRDDYAGVEEVPDAVSRVWSYKGPHGTEKHSTLISHQIIVYANTQAAQEAYSELEARWFPTSRWAVPAWLPYASQTAEQFQFKCISVQISGVPAYSCTAVGQYGDMVSILLANVFEDRWFTWADLEHVLQVIDERMAEETQ